MDEYQKQALEFLSEAGATMEIKYVGDVDGFPFDDHDKRPHRKYRVTIRRNGNSFNFPFYDSYNNWKAKMDPNEYDVLACLQTYDVGEMGDFVEEFGYKIVDRKSFERVEKIWKQCKDEYRNLCLLFDDDLMEKLAEIK